MTVLIPAYEPTGRLAEVVRDLRLLAPHLPVLVVDDGSGPGYDRRFADAAAAGAEVLRQSVNRGKGAALKLGIRHLLATRPGEDVVTADSDGQHTPHDIVAVADAVAGGREFVLGCRTFTGEVPWASRFGNGISRRLFRLAAGFGVSDTQTGLRGIPAGLLEWAAGVPGDRFEYEQNMLLRCSGSGVAVREVGIETVYFDHNSGTHFRPVADSVRVLWPVLAFAASSLAAWAIDTVVFLILLGLIGSLPWSLVIARLVSATVNFTLNGRVVFHSRGHRLGGQIARYLALAGALLAASIGSMTLLTSVGMPALAAKLLTETALFLASYQVQRRLVFTGRRTPPTDPLGRHSHLTETSKVELAG